MPTRLRSIWPAVWVWGLAGVIAGTVMAVQSVRTADADLRAQWLTEARLMARAVDWSDVHRLRGQIEDTARPEYLRVKQRLESLRTVGTQYRFAYLLVRTPDGVVRFLVDSEAPASSDYLPPGMAYKEATPALHRLFDDHTPLSEGPVQDRWGVWVSALVTEPDPRPGVSPVVLGVDVDASHWRRALVRAAMLPLIGTACSRP